jgi:two-component system, response regulator
MNDLTILVAEDDQEQALLITRALFQNSKVSDVILFPNGQEVLNFLFGLSDYNIPGEKYVLLLDTLMPQVSGMEVLKIIKNHETLKFLPVIMFSSLNDPQTLELCYRLGCNAFIPKLVDHNEFEHLSMLDFLSAMEVPDTPREVFIESAS